MRKVILNVAISLDGFIEDANGAFDWCFTDQDYGMTQFLSEIDTLLVGRKSYEVLQDFDDNSFKDYRRIVFSSTMEAAARGWELVKEPVHEYVDNLRQTEGKDLWLFGGTALTHTLLKHQLVDECLLSIHPIALGSGKSLFGGFPERIHFKLLESQPFDSGLVQVRYQVANHGN